MISYIVSAYNDSSRLPICLRSIALQSHRDHEIIVTDNSDSGLASMAIRAECNLVDPSIRYMRTEMPSCYHSAEIGVAVARGDYLCFPSDDSYYMPLFGQIMSETAETTGADLVYCNMVYGGRGRKGHYSVMNVEPRVRKIDKTGFILRRDCFVPFPEKRDDGRATHADGSLIEWLVSSQAVTHAKVSDVLVVHN